MKKQKEMKRFLLMSILLFLYVVTYSQSGGVSIEECIDYALQHSTSVMKQEAKNSINRSNYLESIGRLLPKINASSGAYFNFGRGVDSETNTYTNISSFSNSYNLESSLTVFDGLSNLFRVRMERLALAIGKVEIEQQRERLSLDVAAAYFNYIYCKERERLSQEQLNETLQLLKQIIRMEELGMQGAPNVAEVRAKEASDRLLKIENENRSTIALIQLKEKMNYPLEDELLLSEFDCCSEIELCTTTIGDIYSSALGSSTEATIAIINEKRGRLEYKSERGAFMPRVTFFAGLSTGFSKFMDGSEFDPFEKQLKNKLGKYVGVQISIPIFNGFSNVASLQRARARLEIASREKEELLRRLYSDIAQSVADMNGKVYECRQAEEKVKAMEIAHKTNMRKYKDGLIGAIEMSTSSNRLLEAKIQHLNARMTYSLKRMWVRYYQFGVVEK